MFLFDVVHQKLLLRAMKTVALADGQETPKETALLAIVSETLGVTADAPLEPSDLESLDAAERERVVQCMLLMAVMDGVGSPAEAAVVERFASHLGVSEQRIENLRQLAEGRIARMRFDLTRRGYATEELGRALKEEGLRGVYKTFAPIVGLGADPDLARRYIAFGELPAGTLGRAPFFWLFTIALQFQVGIKISPFSPGLRDEIDPRLFVMHHARGAKVKRDLSVDWDIHADLARPVDELRAQLGIEPI